MAGLHEDARRLGDGIDVEDAFHFLKRRTFGGKHLADDLGDGVFPAEFLVEHPTDLAGVDLALARLPKSLGALDEMAALVQGAPDVTFVGGAKIRHMNRTMNEVLGRHFTAVSASLGRAKSRVLRAWGPEGMESDWPKVREHPDLGFAVAAHGATFGGTKIDAGSRLLISALAGGGRTEGLEADDVLDFGCGNGTLSMWLARQGKRVLARDVSWSAVAATAVAAEVNGRLDGARATAKSVRRYASRMRKRGDQVPSRRTKRA